MCLTNPESSILAKHTTYNPSFIVLQVTCSEVCSAITFSCYWCSYICSSALFFSLLHFWDLLSQNDTFAYVLRTLGLLGLSTHSIAIISVENYCLSMVFKHMFCVPVGVPHPPPMHTVWTDIHLSWVQIHGQPRSTKSSTLPPTSKVACNKQQENIAVQDSIHSSSVACVQENGAHW